MGKGYLLQEYISLQFPGLCIPVVVQSYFTVGPYGRWECFEQGSQGGLSLFRPLVHGLRVNSNRSKDSKLVRYGDSTTAAGKIISDYQQSHYIALLRARPNFRTIRIKFAVAQMAVRIEENRCPLKIGHR